MQNGVNVAKFAPCLQGQAINSFFLGGDLMKVLKRIGIVLGALIGIVLLVVLSLHLYGRSRAVNAPEIAGKPVPIPTDAEAVARGEHLVRYVTLCADCHGENLEGTDFINNEAPIGYIAAPNLTSGEGGIGGSYTDAQWELALRHGVGQDGRALAIMPSGNLNHLSDEDLGAIVAYVKQVPPVDNVLGERNLIFPGTIIFGVLAYNEVFSVAFADHDNPGANVPPEGATAEYGEYLSYIGSCRDCHGPNLAGGIDPNTPSGPNLTPAGELQGWNEEDFITTIRTGVEPSGTQLSDEMPWRAYSGMTDVELQALWAYLASLPAEPTPPAE
jgi:mono/diheme cytochrome c family protein